MPELTSMPAAEAITGGELIPALQGGAAVSLLAAQIAQAPRGAVLLARAPYEADTGSTSAGDPGGGALRWNHASPDSASRVFLSDLDGDAVDHGAVWGSLQFGARLYVQRIGDAGIVGQQVWEVSSVDAEDGYVDLGVSLLAAHGEFGDEDPLQVSLQAAAAGIADAEDVDYDNSSSGLLATHVQAALDELAGRPTPTAGLPWFMVPDFREDGDTDDTAAIQRCFDAAGAAGGAVVYFPGRQGTGANGEYIVGGALQDTSGANAQLLLPDVPYVTVPQITIVLMGEYPPPTIFSVVGDRPVPVGHPIIEGTLNTGAGGKLLTGYSSTSSGNWTNVQVVVRNLTFRMPEDPVFTALDFRLCSNADLDQVVIDTGSYYIQGIDEPTTTGSYGLRMPANNNGAHSRLGTVNICGFYNGFEFAEHCNGFATQATWACKNAFVFASATNHSLSFDRLMATHCTRPIVATGPSYVRIGQLNIEHATTGWWATDYDVYDPSNNLSGSIDQWHAVLAGSGVSSTFTVSGAGKLSIRQLGAADDAVCGLIEAPSNKDYRLVVKAPHRGRILETTTVSASGSCTATFKINTTALGGTANSVSTTEQSRTHSSSNVFAAGDDIVLTISSNSSCADLCFSIRYQRL